MYDFKNVKAILVNVRKEIANVGLFNNAMARVRSVATTYKTVLFKVRIMSKLSGMVDAVSGNAVILKKFDEITEQYVTLLQDPAMREAAGVMFNVIAPKIEHYAPRVESIINTAKPEIDRLVSDIKSDVASMQPMLAALVENQANTNGLAEKFKEFTDSYEAINNEVKSDPCIIAAVEDCKLAIAEIAPTIKS